MSAFPRDATRKAGSPALQTRLPSRHARDAVARRSRPSLAGPAIARVHLKRSEFLDLSATLPAAGSLLSLDRLYASVQKQISTQDSSNKTFDAIVIGVGSMGSATCHFLA